jgi:hypothetical protein
MARGEWRDPRIGTITVGEWHARVSRARAIDGATEAKHASLWATHREPRWTRWQMGAITRMEAQEWTAGLAATTAGTAQGKGGPGR